MKKAWKFVLTAVLAGFLVQQDGLRADVVRSAGQASAGGGGFNGGTVANATTFNSAVTFLANITIPQGGVIGNAGGSNSKLTLSDAAGTTLAYGSNTVVLGASSVTLDAAAASGTIAVDGTSPVVTAPDGAVLRITSDAGATGVMLNTTTAAPVVLATNSIPRMFFAATAKALTEASATNFVQIGVAAGKGAGGEIDYCIHADDGTDFQDRCGEIDFAIVNKAGTMTCSTPNILGTEATALSVGTLTNTFTLAAAAAACNIQANATSSLTQTTLQIRYTVNLHGDGTITPQ